MVKNAPKMTFLNPLNSSADSVVHIGFLTSVRACVRPDFYDGITFGKMIFFQKFFLLYTFKGMLISNEAFRESSSTPS